MLLLPHCCLAHKLINTLIHSSGGNKNLTGISFRGQKKTICMSLLQVICWGKVLLDLFYKTRTYKIIGLGYFYNKKLYNNNKNYIIENLEKRILIYVNYLGRGYSQVQYL